MAKFITILIIILVIIAGVWYVFSNPNVFSQMSMMGTSTPVSTNSGSLIATVNYACNSNKTIVASYYNGAAVAQTDPNQPPTPTGYVTVQLSDGRVMTLNQTISADGTRYSNTDDSFTFWSKGN